MDIEFGTRQGALLPTCDVGVQLSAPDFVFSFDTWEERQLYDSSDLLDLRYHSVQRVAIFNAYGHISISTYYLFIYLFIMNIVQVYTQKS